MFKAKIIILNNDLDNKEKKTLKVNQKTIKLSC